MTTSELTNLRGYFDQPDLQKTWMNIATDIKIRKYDQLDNIPEFRQLPNDFQNQMRSETIPLNGDYKFFDNQQYLDRFYAMLAIKQKEKYLAFYQEKKPSVNTQILLTSIGIGSLCFIWHIFKYLEDTHKLTASQNLNQMTTVNRLVSYTSKHYFTMILTVLSPIAVYFLTRKWIFDSDIRHKQLVHACVLKKLESIAKTG
ncbi:unnamed protein product [Adineta ricciae]|uniref:Uncharacterized protein n=1 Tax=Adineta ricciae TaxID=249248 RepID=A0A815W3M4_ADIRI|nr:unnamed protein product [Adineta ricciae]